MSKVAGRLKKFLLTGAILFPNPTAILLTLSHLLAPIGFHWQTDECCIAMDLQFRVPTSPTSSNDDMVFSSRQPVQDLRPSTLERNQEQLWQNLTRFYDENQLIIERSISLDPKATEDDKTVNSIISVDSWVETANVVLEGLVTLGNVHPILGGAY